MVQKEQSINLAEIARRIDFNDQDFSKNDRETSAKIWAAAQQFTPQQLVEIYGEQKAVKIAHFILIPHEISYPEEKIPYEQLLSIQLTIGTPGLNFDPNAATSYIRDFSWRLEKSIGILQAVSPIHLLSLTQDEIYKITEVWRNKLNASFLLNDDLVSRRFSDFWKKVNDWNKLQQGSLLGLSFFEMLQSSLPKMTPERRSQWTENWNQSLYGISQEEALNFLDSEGKKIDSSSRLQEISKQDIIHLIFNDLKVVYGVDIQSFVKIEGRSAEMDPLLRVFPAYYHPDFKTVVYNTDAEPSEDFLKLMYHEIIHALTDASNISSAEKDSNILLHRSVPKGSEEALTINAELRASTLAKLIPFQEVTGVRERNVYWRAWADAERNVHGKDLTEIREVLEKNVQGNLVQLVLDFIEERPGNYLWGYLALPMKLRQMAEEKGMRNQQFTDWIFAQARAGKSWEKDLLKEMEAAPHGGPYSEIENLQLPEWLQLRELGATIPPLELEKILALARDRIGQTLTGQNEDRWHEIFDFLLTQKNNEPAQETPQQDFQRNHIGFGAVIAELERRTAQELLRANAPLDAYGVNPDGHNPAHMVSEWFELLYYAKNHDFVWQSPNLQEKILNYFEREMEVAFGDQSKENLHHFPFYILQKATKSLREIHNTQTDTGFLKTMPWDESLLQRVERLKQGLSNLGDLYEVTSEVYVGGIRTEQGKFEELLQIKYALSAKEVEELLQRMLDFIGYDVHEQQWYGDDQKPQLRFAQSFAWSTAFGKQLGVPVSIELNVAKLGTLVNYTGVAVAPSNAVMYVTPDLRETDRSKVIETSILQDEKTMSFEEVQQTVWVNLVYSRALYTILNGILENPEYRGETIDNKVMCGFIGHEMMLLLQNDEISSLIPGDGSEAVREFAQNFLNQGSTGGMPQVLDMSGIAKAASLILNEDWPKSDLEYYRKLAMELLSRLCLALPGSDPVAVFLREKTHFVQASPADGVTDTEATQNAAYRQYLRASSRNIWKARIEDVPIKQPLLPVSSVITLHEHVHVWVEALRIIFDKEKKLASSITYGPQSESLATYLAWRITLDTGDEELAQKYLLYNVMRAKADFLLNYGKKIEDEEEDDFGTYRHTTKSSIWQLYCQFLPKGEALDLTTRHVPELRIKPGIGLSYVVDFENWEFIYQYLRKKTGLQQEQAYQALLFLARYRPHHIVEILQSSPDALKEMKALWS